MLSLAKTLTTLTLLAATTSAAPTTQPRDTPIPTCTPGETVRVWANEIYSLFPLAPDYKSTFTQDLNIQYHNETRQAIKQMAVFRGISSTAQNCAFGWQQDAPTTGVIVTGGDVYLRVRQLNGFPSTTDGVSLDDVTPFDTLGEEAEFHPDFTNWDQSSGPAPHSSGPGPIQCGDTVALFIEKDSTKTGHVYLKRTETAGIFIDYKCS